MTLLRRYKAVYQSAVAYNSKAPCLFLEAYMNAAKVLGYPQLMSFWPRVSGYRYSCEELLQMKAQFRKDLRGYVDIEPCTFDWFKMHLEAYSTTDDARGCASAAVEDSVLCSDSPPPGYNLPPTGQPPSYMKQRKLGVNTFRTMLDGEVLELHGRLPHC
ncbi:hypothetical protein BYT27DRAFT_7260242 [Phlegmacium glaucopus]|nr:hypothetical protein BYT27DRAFT_7260242 [Phlegmacium glaucopus]